MAVKIGRIPPRSYAGKVYAGRHAEEELAEERRTASEWPVQEDGWNAYPPIRNPESAARRWRMESMYGDKYPNWQDYQAGRKEMFAGLFEALNGEGIFSKSKGRRKKRVYFPAANRQLETRVFASHCREAVFVGGDIVERKVKEGKLRTLRNNAGFVVADGFHVPFENGSLDAIVDIAGAAWYALDTFDRDEAESNAKSLLHEWHRALGARGVVVLDEFPRDGDGYLPTMRRFEEKCPEIFENIKKGGFYFQAEGDYRVAFKTRTLKLEGGQAYVFEKV